MRARGEKKKTNHYYIITGDENSNEWRFYITIRIDSFGNADSTQG